MVLTQLYEMFAARQRKLRKYINNGHSLTIEQKAELNGAVNEIENFLQALEHMNKKPESNVPEPPRPSVEEASRRLKDIFPD